MLKAKRWRRRTFLSGLTVTAIGSLVLFGWAYSISSIKSVVPGTVVMNPITAFLFVLAGLALFLSISAGVLMLLAIYLLMVSESTRRSKSEAALRDTAHRLEVAKTQGEALLASMGDAVFAVDPAGKIILFNAMASQITGLSVKQALGQPYQKILRFQSDPGGQPESQFIERAMAGHKSAMAQNTQLVRHDGRVVPVADSAAPILLSDGSVEGAIVVFRDVTGDRTAEAQQRSLIQKLKVQTDLATTERAKDEALLKSIGEGLVVINEEGDIENVNDTTLALLGATEKDLIGNPYIKVIEAITDKGQSIDPLDRPIVHSLATGKAVEAYTNFRKQDGSLIPVFLTVSPVLFEGRPIGAVEIFRDISKERELERAKEEFVSLASHQLRTPATGVKAFLSMLRDGYAGQLSPRQLEFIGKAWESNERQLGIVDDMLNVARADSGRMKLAPEQVDITAMLSDIISEQRPTIDGRQQTISYQPPASPITATVDPGKLRMVLENLVSNASKYTPPAGIITITAEAQKTQFVISVADTGVGISTLDIKAKLFQRFSRINNPLSTEVGGSGLGLYLAKKIIDLHRGKIDVTSQVGKGSTFTLSLPLNIRRRA